MRSLPGPLNKHSEIKSHTHINGSGITCNVYNLFKRRLTRKNAWDGVFRLEDWE